MVSQQCQRLSTGLKPGVNETTFEAKPFIKKSAADLPGLYPT